MMLGKHKQNSSLKQLNMVNLQDMCRAQWHPQSRGPMKHVQPFWNFRKFIPWLLQFTQLY